MMTPAIAAPAMMTMPEILGWLTAVSRTMERYIDLFRLADTQQPSFSLVRRVV